LEAYKRLADIYDEYWGKFSLRYALFIRDMTSNKQMPDFAYIRKELPKNGVNKKLLWT
jgi:hypothetical protein